MGKNNKHCVSPFFKNVRNVPYIAKNLLSLIIY